MGLDTCILILTYDGVPYELSVMDTKYFGRPELTRLRDFIGVHNLLTMNKYSAMIYEIDGGAIQALSNSGSIVLSEWNISCVTNFFSSVLDYDAAEEIFVKNPRGGMPPPVLTPGFRMFMLFEG